MAETNDTLGGRVLASYGSHARVALDTDETLDCGIRGKRLRPVSGDWVRLSRADGRQAMIETVAPRRNELARQKGRAGYQVLAANIELMAVVIAPQPSPEPGIVDRYLAAAEDMGIAALLVHNKEDLAAGTPPDWVAEFTEIGYPVIHTSATSGHGVANLARRLAGHVAILVGQSGTGKSTLLNRLVGKDVARTGDISAGTGEGRHTTTTAFLHPLPGGGGLVDSPGVRDFHPCPVRPERVAGLFREIREAATGCRFNDCVHRAEPGCAVRAAVDAGQISARRYRSYWRMYEQMSGIAERNPALFGSD